VNPTTPKRAKQKAEYLKLRRQWLKEHETCEAPMCMGRATEIHHKRGRIGELLNDTRYWLALCEPCHRWVHEHPKAARDAGLLCQLGEWNTVDRTK
jgi:hypothetical protein